jgi:hypothetical protein
MESHGYKQELEELSFALLLAIRNSSQLLRLFVLIKNQKTVSVSIIMIVEKR